MGGPHEASRTERRDQNRRLEACFAYLTDLANDLEWRREWIEAEKTTDGPMAWVPGIG
jgi:hypothetical protein